MAELGRVVMAGGSGFIGRALCSALQPVARDIVVLTRSPRGSLAGVREAIWDGGADGPWMAEVDGADAVVNLSGESVSQRVTPETRQRMVASRVETTQAIARALQAAKAPAGVWLNASGAGIYGDRGDEPLTEASTLGEEGFLVHLAKAWEGATKEAPGETRVILARIGMVLGRDGGAFPVLMKVTRAFAGGALGTGRQWVSWIHVEDLARLLVFAIESSLRGPLNAVAPEPARNADFMAELRRAAGRPWAPPVPSFALRIAGAFGGPDPELPLQSQRALPRSALDAGFGFKFPTLPTAIADLMLRA